MQVVEAYERLQWAGRDPGGLAVLLPFSLNHDRPHEGTNAVAFAETSHRALNFARRDFAGGEVARAVRKSISDLELYASDSSVRRDHREELAGGYRPPVITAREPEVDDLRWFERHLRKLHPLKDRIEKSVGDWEYGVVYAVKFRSGDVAGLRDTSAMGVLADQPVPPELIVGKIRTEGDFEYQSSVPRESLPAAYDGIIKALRSGKKQ